MPSRNSEPLANQVKRIVREHPRITSTEIVEKMMGEGLSGAITELNLAQAWLKEFAGKILRSTREDPQTSFVSIKRDDGEVRDEWISSSSVTEEEAQTWLNQQEKHSRGVHRRTSRQMDTWTVPPYSYQLTFPFYESPADDAVA